MSKVAVSVREPLPDGPSYSLVFALTHRSRRFPQHCLSEHSFISVLLSVRILSLLSSGFCLLKGVLKVLVSS
jgi:hypothetical protein